MRAIVVILACGLTLLATGCATSKHEEAKKEKPAHTRGWIGGEYQLVRNFPKSVAPRPKAGLLLTGVSTNTPVYAAGLRTGDLVLQLDHQPVRNLRAFRAKVDALKPGDSLALSAWRDGQSLELNVPVGQESFRYNGTFGIWFPLVVSPFQAWPTRDHPGFSLIVTGYEPSEGKRAELGSVKNTYQRKCDPKHEPHDDDWRVWLVIFQLSKDESVLKQEMAQK